MNDISLQDAISLAEKYMTEKTIGVEIELLDPCNAERAMIAQAKDNGVTIVSRDYDHDTLDGKWKFVNDGSISGRELVSPPLPPVELFKQLRVVLDLLPSNGYQVNRSCSVHVHHDASKYNNKRLRYFLNHIVKNELNFDQLVSESRRNGGWARSNKEELDCLVQSPDSNEWHRCNEFGIHQCPNGIPVGRNARGSARYRKWNFHSFGQYGTLECRQHQGSLDFSKYVLWICLTQGMVSKCYKKVSYTKGWDNPACNMLMSLGFAKRVGKAIKPHCPLAKWVCESVASRMTEFGFADRAPEIDDTPDHLEKQHDEIYIAGCGWTPQSQLRILFPSLAILD
jgi:hypothetical protein